MGKRTSLIVIYFKGTLSSVDTLFTYILKECVHELRYGTLKGKDSRTKLRILIQSFVLRSPFLGEMSEGQRGVQLFVVL